MTQPSGGYLGPASLPPVWVPACPAPAGGGEGLVWHMGPSLVAGGGYHLLQLLLEEAYPSMTFAQIMQPLLHHLGMQSSGFIAAPTAEWPAALAESRCPRPDRDFRGCQPYADAMRRLPNLAFPASSAAGLYSTAHDFTLFLAAHMSPSHDPDPGLRAGLLRDAMPNGIRNPDPTTAPAAESCPGPDSECPGRGALRPDTIAEMARPQWVFSGGRQAWGLGYQLAVVPVVLRDGRRVMGLLQGHTGSNPGWKLVFGLIADLGVGITVHTNGDAGKGVTTAVMELFTSWLAGGCEDHPEG